MGEVARLLLDWGVVLLSGTLFVNEERCGVLITVGVLSVKEKALTVSESLSEAGDPDEEDVSVVSE